MHLTLCRSISYTDFSHPPPIDEKNPLSKRPGNRPNRGKNRLRNRISHPAARKAERHTLKLMAAHRAERVSEALREELGELIGYELSDPRIGEATVTEVLVSPDMKHAQVRLHLASDASAQQETIQALDRARHFLRRQLAERLNLYRVPELHFEADVAASGTARVNQLLKRVRRGRPRDERPSS